MKKSFFFFIYFNKILNFYLKGILLTKNKLFCNINRLNLFFIINFFKNNLLSGFSSLLDIIVVDNVNYNKNRFEVTYFF
jgi:hypothetical protein